MTYQQHKQHRREPRKFKRIPVRYGTAAPTRAATAMQISTRGLFLSTNDLVYEKGSAIVIEIKGPAETWLVRATVRHAYKVHPELARFTKPGMGIELLDVPPALKEYLASL